MDKQPKLMSQRLGDDPHSKPVSGENVEFVPAIRRLLVKVQGHLDGVKSAKHRMDTKPERRLWSPLSDQEHRPKQHTEPTEGCGVDGSVEWQVMSKNEVVSWWPTTPMMEDEYSQDGEKVFASRKKCHRPNNSCLQRNKAT